MWWIWANNRKKHFYILWVMLLLTRFLWQARTLCFPGHFCGPGTLTSNVSDMSTNFRPRPCPRGYYCGLGVATSVSQIGNFSTPQPCQPGKELALWLMEHECRVLIFVSGYHCNQASETQHGQGPCPAGFHCPQVTIFRSCNKRPSLHLKLCCQYAPGVTRACPPRTFCPGLTNVEPKPCSQGAVYLNWDRSSWQLNCPLFIFRII